MERCAGFVDMLTGEAVDEYNTAYLFYTDLGGNATAQHVNETGKAFFRRERRTLGARCCSSSSSSSPWGRARTG